MSRSVSLVQTEQCSVCHEYFETPRRPGRPPENCSDACRRRAKSQHQARYIRRLIDARQQVAQLTAAIAA